jgi:UDP-3-O-acyl N-acetylglucosamine deacetylase
MAEETTIARAAELHGIGLHTGAAVRLELLPAPAGAGVTFVRTDLPDCPKIEASLENLHFRPRRTVLARGGAEVNTTEHLLSALAGSGVRNVEVRLDGPELPGLDGSAQPYLEAILGAGVAPQGLPAPELTVTEPIVLSENGAFLAAVPEPQGGFRVSYTLDYRQFRTDGAAVPPSLEALLTQHLDFLLDPTVYAREIAPARTFVFEDEVRALRAANLGMGANSKNTVVLGREGIVDNELRFRDEFVRHKVLDLLGDLYLLGVVPSCRVVELKSGHALNVKLALKIQGQLHSMRSRDN